VEEHDKPEHDHAAVSVFIWYVIAGMIVACTVLVMTTKGIKAMPFDAVGLVGAVVFAVASLGMAQFVKRQEH
jgi:hypothetical protein